MNAVQFGRWLSERRRAGGWPSQRLLAEAALQQPLLCQSGISEDFLSRLEAGHLAHPFRGTVRRRVLLLAWLLCKTPRDLRSYLKAAGLTDCSDAEQTQIQSLSEHLATLQTPPPLLLPARPAHLKGREAELEHITRLLSNPTTRVLALTGMPGVGKSALAYEILHRLASEEKRLRQFPDGIATFTCTGRQGTRGLISLLREITALFAIGSQYTQDGVSKRHTHKHTSGNAYNRPFEDYTGEPDLAEAIDRARAALANKRVLLLLDDLDPAFPLRQALDVLLAQGTQTLRETKTGDSNKQRVILTTSQFVPAPALVPTRLHIQPLHEAAALDLLSELVGQEFSERDRHSARQACAAVGYLPLAIEGMATAVHAKGIPLSLVTAHVSAHPLGGLLDSEEEVVAEIERALAALEQNMRADYLLLAALDLPAFDLYTATAILSSQRLSILDLESASPTMAHLAGTAAILGQFVRSSLLERLPLESATEPQHNQVPLLHAPTNHAVASGAIPLASNAGHGSRLLMEMRESPTNAPPGSEVHYRMHTLLYHYARGMAHTLPAERLELARHNLLAHTRLAQN